MIKVNATDLKNQTGKYIEQAAIEDIIILKNGKEVALLTNIKVMKKQAVLALRGIIEDTGEKNRNQIREARLENL